MNLFLDKSLHVHKFAFLTESLKIADEMFNNITTNQHSNLYYDKLTFLVQKSSTPSPPTAVGSSPKPFHQCWFKPSKWCEFKFSHFFGSKSQALPLLWVQASSPPTSLSSSQNSSHCCGFKLQALRLLWVQAQSPPIAVCPSPKPSQSCGFKSQALPTLLIKLQVISVMGLSPKSSHCCWFKLKPKLSRCCGLKPRVLSPL